MCRRLSNYKTSTKIFDNMDIYLYVSNKKYSFYDKLEFVSNKFKEFGAKGLNYEVCVLGHS